MDLGLPRVRNVSLQRLSRIRCNNDKDSEKESLSFPLKPRRSVVLRVGSGPLGPLGNLSSEVIKKQLESVELVTKVGAVLGTVAGAVVSLWPSNAKYYIVGTFHELSMRDAKADRLPILRGIVTKHYRLKFDFLHVGDSTHVPGFGTYSYSEVEKRNFIFGEDAWSLYYVLSSKWKITVKPIIAPCDMDEKTRQMLGLDDSVFGGSYGYEYYSSRMRGTTVDLSGLLESSNAVGTVGIKKLIAGAGVGEDLLEAAYSLTDTAVLKSRKEVFSPVLLEVYVEGTGRGRLGDCPICQTILLILEEKGILYKSYMIDMSKKPQWFLKDNPKGTVPALIFDGKWITDSAVIIKTIEDKFSSWPSLGTPVEYASIGTKIFGAFNRFLVSKDGADGSEEALVTELAALDQHLRIHGPYINEVHLSSTDLILAPQLYHMEVALAYYKSWNVPDSLSHVRIYMKLIFSRASFVKTVTRDKGSLILRYSPVKLDAVLALPFTES